MSLSTTVTLSLKATLKSVLDLVSADAPLSYAFSKALATGTGSGLADAIFSDHRAVSEGADLDLKGALKDATGAAFTPAKLKMALIFAKTTNVANLKIGGDAASVPLFGDPTDVLLLPPGGLFFWLAPVAGVAVTATTGDILQIDSTTVTDEYDVVLIGTSA